MHEQLIKQMQAEYGAAYTRNLCERYGGVKKVPLSKLAAHRARQIALKANPVEAIAALEALLEQAAPHLAPKQPNSTANAKPATKPADPPKPETAKDQPKDANSQGADNASQ